MEDIFCSLPDEILGHIVSFLPNESALYTSLLSTRWRNLWNETLVRYGSLGDLSEFVAQFLARFEELRPLKHPRRLRCHYAEIEDRVLSASIAANNKLLLDFSGRKKEEEDPESHYGMRLKLNIQNPQPFSPSTFLIKTLYLKSVCCLTSEVVSSIVSSLQHLENLIITGCAGLESLCIDGETKLLKLTILDCLQLNSLQLRTCRLRFFRYRGLLPRILPENHFNLADAMLDFRQGPICYDFKTEDFDTVLLTIKNSEILTLCEWNYRALIWPSISPQIGSFIFYKLKELWWIVKDGQSSDALVSFLKLCPALEILYVTVDPESYFTGSPASCLKEATKYKELEHLRLIKLMGFRRKEDEISVAKDLIQLVKVKKYPRIEASDGSCLQILRSFSRDNNERRELARQETEINELCPKHPHMRC